MTETLTGTTTGDQERGSMDMNRNWIINSRDYSDLLIPLHVIGGIVAISYCQEAPSNGQICLIG